MQKKKKSFKNTDAIFNTLLTENGISDTSIKQDRQRTCNIILWCVHIIVVVMETHQNVLFVLLTKILCTAINNIKVLRSSCKVTDIFVQL